MSQAVSTKRPARGKSNGGGKLSRTSPPVVGVPNWLIPILVNVLVLVAGVTGTWFTMQGDIGNLKMQISGLNAAIVAQTVRTDGMIKEQERVTRLEERLVNIATLLQEIKSDLREGRYPTRREGGLAPR